MADGIGRVLMIFCNQPIEPSDSGLLESVCVRKYLHMSLEQSLIIYEPQSIQFVKEPKEQADSTAVQSQLLMEGVELFLDLLWTGAVLPGAEVQQDVYLRGGDKQNNKASRTERVET